MEIPIPRCGIALRVRLRATPFAQDDSCEVRRREAARYVGQQPPPRHHSVSFFIGESERFERERPREGANRAPPVADDIQGLHLDLFAKI